MNEPRDCRFCGAKIIDAVDTNGTRQVLDARNHPIFIELPDGHVQRCSETTRISHWATCRKAEDAKAAQATKQKLAPATGEQQALPMESA